MRALTNPKPYQGYNIVRIPVIPVLECIGGKGGTVDLWLIGWREYPESGASPPDATPFRFGEIPGGGCD